MSETDPSPDAAQAGETLRILFVGDVVGKPGRRILQHHLLRLIDARRVDFSIVNIENAAGGMGVTPGVFDEIDRLPIDCYTTGNHAWDKREGVRLYAEQPRLLRPDNYPEGNPGSGLHIGETASGRRVATINLEGQVFMKALPSPFEAADRLLRRIENEGGADAILVDFHAEATSEKQAMGFHLDGRVSAVVGTHTHAPTADERILPGGTAFLTDVGMTGPYEGIIGFRADKVLQRFALQRHVPFEVAKRDPRLAAVLVDVDPETGHAIGIERLLLQRDQPIPAEPRSP